MYMIFFSFGLVLAVLCSFFDFCIVNLWNEVNKIAEKTFELGPVHDIWLKV